MLLIDRLDELKWLEQAYNSGKAEFVIVYGRRRLGKTFLVKNFIQDKEHFYFLAKQRSLDVEFQRLKLKFSKKFNVFLEAKNFEEFFTEIFEKVSFEKKLVFVIDEFPYWMHKDAGIVSEFQYLWDELLVNKNVMLILVGSYVSMMEEKLLGYNSPLYGRSTSHINVKEMPLKALTEFFPRFGLKHLVEIYGLTDTIPYYLQMIESKDLTQNLLRLLNPNHNYFQDAEILLKEEVRDYNTYIEILRAVNEGKTKLNEIANAARVDITNILKYIKVLLGMRILRKVKPVTSSFKE